MLRRPPRLALMLLALGVLAGVVYGSLRPRLGLVGVLSRELNGHVVPGVQLSIGASFRTCESTFPGDNAGCLGEPPPRSRRIRSVIDSASRAARRGNDADALHAAGLVNLLYADPTGKLLGRSISYLQTASRLARHPAPVLADLSAAYLKRAEQTGSAYDLFRALEASERALELEPRNRAARFNTAQALDRIRLPRQSAAAWADYAAADPGSPWGAQARHRMRALSVPPFHVPKPARSAGAAQLEAYAVAAPAEARDLGWEGLLADWGTAVRDGDTATARLRIAQAAVLGAALQSRGGDASLADAASAIQRLAPHGPSIRRMARAHTAFAAARRKFVEAHYTDACATFARVQDDADAGPLLEWARTFMGMCLLYAPQPGADLLPTLRTLAGQADTLRYPAVAGRRRWCLGTALQGAGRYDEALAAYRRAQALFVVAKEEEHAAAVRALIGNAYAELGDADSAYVSLHASLAVLGNHASSVPLHNLLYALRNAALADGLPRTAMRVQEEAVARAADLEPAYQAESRLARARLRVAAGLPADGGDVATAEFIIRGLDSGYVRDWLTADLQEARAATWLGTRPEQAVAELEGVIEYFAGEQPRLVPALFTRATARLRLGDRPGAARDLRSAARVLDSLRTSVSSAQLRASLLEASRSVFDQAVMLSVHAGRPDEALEYVEQSRASFAPVGARESRPPGDLQMPPGLVGVELALVADTLLAWTLRGADLVFTRMTMDHSALVRDVERVRSALEQRADEAAVLPALEALYDRIVRPLGARLGPSGTPLVIVADGELAALPFAALRDRRSRRYLLEDHAILFAGSLRGFSPLAGPPKLGTVVTLVTDPAFNRATYPELQPLPEATAEGAAVARHYRGARVIHGAQARTSTLSEAFRRGGIAHFAGHAIFDDTRPERSFLVAAAGPGPARLTAAEVEGMELSRLRLVVLSACRTSRATAGRSGGFAGLAGAFLAAGAGGVVGSLWQVDDGDTRVLMEGFHAAYARSGNAAEALRQAQLGMLRSGNPALRSPAAWTGFRYMGR